MATARDISGTRPSIESGNIGKEQDHVPTNHIEEVTGGQDIDIKLTSQSEEIFFTEEEAFLDKTLINYSSIFGLKQALKLHGSQYSWLGSIFYIGYMIGSIVWAKLVHKWPQHTGKLIAAAVLAWSCIVLLTPLCFNFAGIMAARFFLGLVESVIGPVFVIVTSNWWTRPEQAFRTAFWLGGTPWQHDALDICESSACLLHALPESNRAGRLAGYYLTFTHSMSFTLSTGLMASNYAGNTKKSTASGIIFAGWAAGLIAGPQFFLDSQAPVYDLAFRMLMGCYALMIIIPILQYLWYRHENNRRDQKLARDGSGAEEVLRTEFSDKTDFERWQTFRYTL
ncbi:hypothetical protein TrVFT333_002524 [Trichoderma virens FT-333]|nr:hypothetical protein TrVFT333_002524 [Trichoderma virens FT-333]